MQQPTAVVFGAGKLACGLLGPLLNRAGLRVVYVARRAEVVAAINRNQGFSVQVKTGRAETLAVSGCSAIPMQDAARVVEQVAAADVVFTAVGIENLGAVTRLLGAGLWRRRFGPDPRPLNIVACENLPGAGHYLRHQVLTAMRSEVQLAVEQLGGFSAGLTRRIMTGGAPENGRLVFAIDQEPDLIVDADGLQPGFPEVPGAVVTEDFAEMVMRKLFTVNCAQAVAAYLGHLEGCQSVHEAATHPRIAPVVKGAMQEAAAALAAEYPRHASEIRREALAAVRQIANPRLADTVRRIARDPRRKLSPRERLVGPARLAAWHGLEAPNLTRAIAAALHYDDQSDSQAVAMQEAIAKEGVERVLTEDCGLLPYQPQAREVKRQWCALRAAAAPAAQEDSLTELLRTAAAELTTLFDSTMVEQFLGLVGDRARVGLGAAA